MFRIHEGEIVVKEKYGSNANEILYVKPPEQTNLVVLYEKKTSKVSDWFTHIFLPHGYPKSVSPDYIAYQVWDTAQAFCSTIAGILATQEVLKGVGVGDANTTPLAATITWVIKDGCGHVGKILFAFTHGTYLDAFSKKWRLYADTLNDAAMCLEIALPLFKNYTTFVLSISTVMKAIVGVAGGATRAAMTQHHAVCGNMADVSAKDAAQETAVNLFASFTALLIISLFGNSLMIFMLMVVLHITFNYMAVRAICLQTLNEPRFLQLIDLYLKKELVTTPCEINRKEPIIFYNLGPYLLDMKLCGFKIILGQSITKVLHLDPKVISLRRMKTIYEYNWYLLVPDINVKRMYIFIKEGATTSNILCAYFHSILLSIITSAINDEPLAIYRNPDDGPFALLCHSLRDADWTKELVDNQGSISGFAYNPSINLMTYLDNIVRKEWTRISKAIGAMGWDLNKHLLIVDDWRILKNKDDKNPVIAEQKARKLLRVREDEKIYLPEEKVNKASPEKTNKKKLMSVEPNMIVDNKESGKMKLEQGYKAPEIESRAKQNEGDSTDTIESVVSKSESTKRNKKKD